MRQYLRYRVEGGTYFFTLVTHRRRPIFVNDLARGCLRSAFREVRCRWPFEIVAIVVLPEHLHCVLELPPEESNYSLRLQKIKEKFTRSFLAAGGQEGVRNPSHKRKEERAVWQRRFWEHTCRDEDEVKLCVDYVHWNPTKHGLAVRIRDYPWSSFHRYVLLAEYEPGWGGEDPCPGWKMPE